MPYFCPLDEGDCGIMKLCLRRRLKILVMSGCLLYTRSYTVPNHTFMTQYQRNALPRTEVLQQMNNAENHAIHGR